jgi:hypothetical protein
MRTQPDPRRSLVAEGVIGLGLCLGLHFLLVGPLQKKLGERRDEISRLTAAEQETGTLATRMPEVMESLLKQTEAAAAISERGAVVHDEGAMFTEVMSLASGSGVRVELMEPLKDDPLAPPPGAPEGTLLPRPGDRSLSYSISATGGYAQMCAFIRALQNDLAYTLVRSVRLSPAPVAGEDEHAVAAVIETAHVAVDVSLPLPTDATTAAPTDGGAR